MDESNLKVIKPKCVNLCNNSFASAGFMKKKWNTKYISVMRSAEPTNYHRPDPTVPHLKYGLFPRSSNKNRAELKTRQVSSPTPARRRDHKVDCVLMPYLKNAVKNHDRRFGEREVPVERFSDERPAAYQPKMEAKERKNVPRKLKKPMENSNRSEPIASRTQKTMLIKVPKYQPEKEPMMVFRPVDQNDFRHLTISTSTHLDIKPRVYMRS